MINKIKHILLASTILLNITNIFAGDGLTFSVKNNIAGTLSTIIPDSLKSKITDLEIAGDINGTDIQLIRQMLGIDNYFNKTKGNLSALDLSGSNIVEGGNAYGYNNIYTQKTTIGPVMFSKCTTLKYIKLPNNLTIIDGGAFSGCSGLSTIFIPKGVNYIEKNPFIGCLDLNEIIVSEDNLEYSSLNGALYNKDKTKILSLATYKGSDFKLPETLLSIEHSAFSRCNGLTTISIPKSVKSINDNAFFGCNELTSIIIPDNVIYIGVSAFESCSNLKTVSISNNLTAISVNSFSECSSLSYVKLPRNLNIIEAGAFWKCENLKTIDFTPNIVYLGNHSFRGCKSLKNITIPENLITIKINSFAECDSIKQFSVHENNLAFCSVDGVLLSKDKTMLIAFPEGLSNDIIIPSSIKVIGNRSFWGNGRITKIFFPPTLESIDDYAFNDCAGLTTLLLPEHLSNLGNGAFLNCSGLQKINFPKGIKDLRKRTLEGCVNLREIHCESNIPPIVHFMPFINISMSDCKLFVPVGSYQSYRLAEGWKEFNNIIEESFSSSNKRTSIFINIHTEDNTIIINGENTKKHILIYSILGNLLFNIKETKKEVKICMPLKSVYIVCIDGKKFKVAL